MPKTLRRLAVTALIVLGTAAPGLTDVNVKHAEADYGSWKTWSFADNPEHIEALEAAGHAEISKLIRESITKRLAKKGYELTSGDGAPDFRIALEGTLREVFDVQNYHQQVSEHVAFVLDGGSSSYQEGTLLIRVLEGSSDKVVWTGWVTEDVRNPDKPGRQIERVVKKILRRFPPGGN
ncbi:MAG: DUF4136 domain-containing protein [Acidobacteriota bacterium]